MQELRSSDDWGIWRYQPETIAFFEMLDTRVHQAMVLWSHRAFQQENAHMSALNNHAALTKVEALRELSQLDYEGYLTVMKEPK